jgi:hypothetical protein
MVLAAGEVGLPGSTTAPPSRLYQAVQSSMMAFCSASVCGMPLPPLYNTKYFAIAFVSSRPCIVGPVPAYAGHFSARTVLCLLKPTHTIIILGINELVEWIWAPVLLLL